MINQGKLTHHFLEMANDFWICGKLDLTKKFDENMKYVLKLFKH